MGHTTTASTKVLSVLAILSGLLSLETIKVAFSHGNLDHDHVVGCAEMERKALLNFKQGLTDPSGQLSSWVGEDCCKWRGVGCNNITGRVVQVNLRNTNSDMDLNGDAEAGMHALGGEINPSLLSLTDLSYLDFSMNDFR
ncbi:LRR domain containing protein, partial [Trema orientale]